MVKNKRVRLIFNISIGIVFLIGIFTFYSTFSLGEEYQFESEVYQIEDGYIKNISPNTEVSLFQKYFDLANCSVEVVNFDNTKLESGLVANGTKTILYDDNHSVISSYVNVIKGDYTGDGLVDDADFKASGKCLIQSCSLEEYQILSLDIDGDNELHINDLVLLDKTIATGYQGISLNKEQMVLQSEEVGRLVAEVVPSYGLNQNVNWSSLDEAIATVDDAGRVTGHVEGETKIQAMTPDGKFVAEATIKVDNTIQLLSYQGTAYVGGNDLSVGIKLIDYEGVLCSSSNEEVATCEIQDKNLVMKANKQGNVTITVTSPNYGEVTYQLVTYSVYLNVMPKYLCTTPGNISYITVSGFHSGDLSFDASDKEIIKDSYMAEISGRRMLKIEFGNKQGRAILNVKESNGNSSNEVTVDVYQISIPQIGSVAKIGQDVSTTIAGDHLGELSCVSEDTEKATCRIEGNQLIVTPLALGTVTIDVYNQFSYNNELYSCGKAQFLVVIQE